jgi:hypothetical protein
MRKRFAIIMIMMTVERKMDQNGFAFSDFFRLCDAKRCASASLSRLSVASLRSTSANILC